MAVDRAFGLGRVVRAHEARADVGAPANRGVIATDVSTQAHAHDLVP
jgi:hypothetical protein